MNKNRMVGTFRQVISRKIQSIIKELFDTVCLEEAGIFMIISGVGVTFYK